MSSEQDLISAKELASQLKVSDALLKKIIKDFGLSTERIQKRIHLGPAEIQTIREIMALRASGKKNKEIKEMFEAAQAENQKDQESQENKDSETPRPEPTLAETKAETTTKEETQEEAAKAKENTTAEKTEEETEKPTSEEKPKRQRRERKKPREPRERNTRERKKTDNAEEKAETETKKDIPAEELHGMSAEEVLAYTVDDDKEDESKEPDASAFLDNKEEYSDEELEKLLDTSSEEAIDDLDDEDDLDDSEEVEQIDGKITPRKIRRRQFSFRYIQRQIATDSKRVNYIKQKLRRSRLSTLDKLQLEESLQHRSRLLSGWVQLLRWVKS